jgi:flagellar biogenesis protein FliO
VTSRFRAGIVLAMALLLAAAQPAWCQAKPAAPSAQDSPESSPIYPAGTSSAAGKPDQSANSNSGFDVTRVVLALAAVIALILVLRTFARRVVPGVASHRSTSAVKIVGRCPITPRQNLLIVQFGKRLVLVGDAGANLNPLCEISDPDEVASILTHARDETISVAKRFESLFGRARKDFNPSPEEESPDQFEESRDIKADDPAIQDTQKELSDLREKVRDVARQIGRA